MIGDRAARSAPVEELLSPWACAIPFARHCNPYMCPCPQCHSQWSVVSWPCRPAQNDWNFPRNSMEPTASLPVYKKQLHSHHLDLAEHCQRCKIRPRCCARHRQAYCMRNAVEWEDLDIVGGVTTPACRQVCESCNKDLCICRGSNRGICTACHAASSSRSL